MAWCKSPFSWLILAWLWAAPALSQRAKLDSLLRQLATRPKDDARVELLLKISYAHVYAYRDSAIIYGKQAQVLAEKSGLPSQKSTALRHQGLGYLTKGDLATALRFFDQSLAVARPTGNLSIVGLGLSSLGLVYLEMGNYPLAAQYYHQALAILQQVRAEQHYALVLSNLGYIHANLDHPDSAEYFFARAAPLAKQHRPDFGAFIHNNLANLHLQAGRREQARRSLALAQALAQQYDDQQDLSDGARLLAELHLAQGDLDSALAQADRSLRIAQAVNLKRNIYQAYQVGSQIYEAKRDTPAAFAHYKKATVYKDSVQSKLAQNALLLFEMEKKQGETVQLRLAQQRQQMIVNTSLLALLLLSSLGVALWVSYRKTKKVNRALTLANQHLQETKEEVMAQNEELQLYQEEIKGLNDSLERLVGEKSSELAQRNLQLTEYAFFNAHGLRAPVATILGLYEVLRLSPDPAERERVVGMVGTAVAQLDAQVRENQQLLGQGRLDG
jgi:tetratricopeptide (TPR) repeat protein